MSIAAVLAQTCLPALPEPAEDVGCASAGGCIEREPRYCVSDQHCESGQSCCISGLIGSCIEAGPGFVCPQADLRVEVAGEALGLSLEARVFDPELDACAIEKGCVGGVGQRLLLHFSAAVRNVGDADLLFGTAAAPPYAQAACDGQPYFAEFLTYSLVDTQGSVQASGHQEARCDAQAAYASRFDCQFNGIERGAAQVHSARPLSVALDLTARAGTADSVDAAYDATCQWVDVTDVAAGDYLLRIQVNAAGLLAEARSDDNRVEVPVTLPALGAPTQPCPSIDETLLLGYGDGRECGWAALGPALSCTPGTALTAACATCSGAPLLRVCEGSLPCTRPDALGMSYSSEPAPGECPKLDFVCPASGRYTAYQTPSGRSEADARCLLQITP